MSEQYLDLTALAHGQPATDAEREAQHQVLASLLAAYTDGELPAETTSQIDAHLLGCAQCRREVDVQRTLGARVRELSAHVAPVDTSGAEERLRARLAERLAALPPRAVPDAGATVPRARGMLPRLLLGIVTVLLIVAVALTTRDARSSAGGAEAALGADSAPLLADVARDYTRTMSSELPGRARDLDAVRAAMPFAVEPLHVDGLRLLATWTTVVGGQPAAVFAYRWNDRIVLQYIVAEELLFRSPAVRASLAARGRAMYGDGRPALIAWPLQEAGSVLVGEVTPAALRGLWSRATGR